MNSHSWDDISDTTQPMRYLLALSDGQRYALTTPTLIGRNPHREQGEESFACVMITDPDRTVSKTHLLIAVDSAGPYVMDRRSTNGTVVTLPDHQQIICGPGQRVRFSPGTTILFGQFSLSVELHR